MLPDQLDANDADEAQSERRRNSVRLYVIRDGRLVELERRERPRTTAAETQAPPVLPANVKRD